MRVKVEFSSSGDVKKFSEIVQSVDCDVRLIGKDENGNDWNLSAKSLFCSLIIEAKAQRMREHTAHEVDWNTIYCECEKDIYNRISQFIID
jgi:hypothetical protein